MAMKALEGGSKTDAKSSLHDVDGSDDDDDDGKSQIDYLN